MGGKVKNKKALAKATNEVTSIPIEEQEDSTRVSDAQDQQLNLNLNSQSQDKTSLLKVEEINPLPPHLPMSNRPKIEPEQVPSDLIQAKSHRRKKPKPEPYVTNPYQTRFFEVEEEPPKPRHMHALSWWPDALCFKLDDKVVEHTLNVSNRSCKLMYVRFARVWNDEARLGASWWIYPKIRFHIAPGLAFQLVIRAKPKETSPIPLARSGLQLATCYQGDNVVGYFFVPITARFYNYVPEEIDETSTEEPEEERVKEMHGLEISKTAEDLHKMAENLHKGVQSLHKGTDNLHKGAENLHKGAENLHKGAENLHKGAENLHKGAENLHKGAEHSHKATDNVHKATDNVHKAADNLHK